MNSIGDVESTHELLKKIRNGKISNDAGGNCCDCEESYIESEMDIIDKPKKTKQPKQPKQPKQKIPQIQQIQQIQQIKEPKKTKKVKETIQQPIPQQIEKKDNDLYILTEKGRYVLKSGSIGKKVIEQLEEQKNQLKEEKKIKRLQKKQLKEQLKK